MINRRQALKAAVAAIPLSRAMPQEQLKRTTLTSQDLPAMDGANLMVTVQELEYVPGGTSEAHRHNGCTFVYVLAGEILTQIDDGPVKTYKPGEMFYEPPLHLHAISKNASSTERAKFLVFRVIEKGKPATVPAK
ncbi:MAG TPA: cupin domain-containing protein [Bryobacteraceae bacterium]|nr:cupin domain-containing protein [Bryobacteraceae bacterium]